jgi:hypothetical protein
MVIFKANIKQINISQINITTQKVTQQSDVSVTSTEGISFLLSTRKSV